MHKLMSSRNSSSNNDVINKNHHHHHHHHHHHQQQPQQHSQLLQKQTQLQTTQQSQSQQQQKQEEQQQKQQQQQQQKQQQQQQQKQQQKQQQQQQEKQQKRHNYSNKTKINEVNNYEKFFGNGTIKSISEIQPSKVKMSGYLKKKRTKVGGWRKMWFVLQNQLLLSYSSKENYDKKLVSFKDVLNLIPGTTIHPLGSFRFAIETTTNVMYNFRCDDSESYNEWLSALMESLSLNLQQQRSSKNKCTDNKEYDEKHHKFRSSISLDNIQKQTSANKKSIKSCNSSDSISRFNLIRTPNIPIADATAKILQRNGIPSTGANNNNNDEVVVTSKKISDQQNNRHRSSIRTNSSNSNHSGGNRSHRQMQEQLESCSEQQERARNFRLHEKRLSSGILQQNLHQSDEVSRINRMFSSRSRNNANNVINPQQILYDRNSFVTIATATTSAASATASISTSSPYSSIVNIVGNSSVIDNNKVKSSSTSLSSNHGTSVVGVASIISLKEGYGRCYGSDNNKHRHSNGSSSSSSSRNPLNLNAIYDEKLNHQSNGNDFARCYGTSTTTNFDNRNFLDHKLTSQPTHHNNKSSEKQINRKNYREIHCNSGNGLIGIGCSGGGQKSSSSSSDIQKKFSNQFFPVMMTTNNIMTKDNNIFNMESDRIDDDDGHRNSNKSSNGSSYSNNKNSPIKYKKDNKIGDNNGSSNNKINNSNSDNKNGSGSSSSNSSNGSDGINKNTTNDDNGSILRDLNQNQMFHLNYEKVDFQKDKDGDDAYECYPLQQKMQDLNICIHQQKPNNKSEVNKSSNKRITQEHSEKPSISLSSSSSPFKTSASLERTGLNPFYIETEFPLHSLATNQLDVQLLPTSSHQSLQNFSRINSPAKDEISLSSSSTTTSNSRCNSSLVTTTESSNSMTNSPTNDAILMPEIQRQHHYRNEIQRHYTKILDSRIHPDLQPCESIEDDLHMMSILVHNDGDGESHTEDILENIILDEQRPTSVQSCMATGQHNLNSTEPIYALVDLKNKHARRAKLRELQDQLTMLSEARDRERPRSLQCISSDYEEVLNFECMQNADDDAEVEDEDDDENENIYEPINIPEYAQHRQQHNHRHALWKYFRRINIEALLEIARNKKLRSPSRHANVSKYNGTTLHPTMSLPPDAYSSSSHQNQHQTSPFSDIRRKLGNHRKSIKLRMKRFYNRNDLRSSQNVHSNAIIKERNAFSDDELDSQGATGSTGSGTSENSLKSSDGIATVNEEKRKASFVFGEIDKYRRTQKQFFGSLTRLKKTRTSVSLEENDVKTSFINTDVDGKLNNNGSNHSSKPWLISPKMNRSEEKISISNKYPKKNDDIPNQGKFFKN